MPGASKANANCVVELMYPRCPARTNPCPPTMPSSLATRWAVLSAWRKLARRVPLALLAACGLAACGTSVAHAAAGGQLELKIVDHDSGQPLACRIHLKNQKNRAQKPPKVPFWHDHFLVDGGLTLKLPVGNYTFVVERGPEYLVVTGHFEIQNNAQDSKTIELRRFVDMSKEGWWSGDLEIERTPKEIEMAMLADDLHLGEQVTWGNLKELPKAAATADPLVAFADQRFYRSGAGVLRRSGGSLLVLGLAQPPAAEAVDREPLDDLIAAMRKEGKPWIDVRRATSWDLPIWIALGLVDSIELADSQLARDSTKADTAGTRPRNPGQLVTPGDVGRWTEAVYYNLLNCGLRLPPSAGSGSGVAPNPVGYNRVYVHVDEPFSYDAWLENLRAGRVVVTNGPLIRPNVGGELPGYTFQADAGHAAVLEVGLTLSSRDPISYLEIVRNGRTVQEVRLDQWVKAGGKLPPLEFRESGWFVVRAVTDLATTHRFASTGPYYVEIGYQPRISRSAVQFFLDWLDERGKRPADKNADPSTDIHLERARAYWQDLLSKANAD